ncbi:MAG: hypothetical protein JRI22_15720 [Deltaproteobacteria bacterium]|nr:hypothetical protein [Deltaproteobacteria bacterium]
MKIKSVSIIFLILMFIPFPALGYSVEGIWYLSTTDPVGFVFFATAHQRGDQIVLIMLEPAQDDWSYAIGTISGANFSATSQYGGAVQGTFTDSNHIRGSMEYYEDGYFIPVSFTAEKVW